MKLTKDFYTGTDVVSLAKELIGKCLFTNFENNFCGGIITETEAYAGITDKASHAYNNRFTKRTEIMFREGGIAYVYLCYGMYSLFNVVTNKENIPHAILIRSIFPTEGKEIMQKRFGKNNLEKYKLNGPGKLSKAMGIHYSHSGINLLENKIWIEDLNIKLNENEILSTNRIGIDYAGEDALLPYRFVYQANF